MALEIFDYNPIILLSLCPWPQPGGWAEAEGRLQLCLEGKRGNENSGQRVWVSVGYSRVVNQNHSQSDEAALGLSLDFAQEEGWRPMGCQVWALDE